MDSARSLSATHSGKPGSSGLVSPDWLAAHLHEPGVRVVEVDVSAAAYNDWHIDGAVLWDVYRDLKDADYCTIDATSLESLLGRSGITPETTVVLYGYGSTFGFWLLELIGHQDARILDCDRNGWKREGRPWTKALQKPVQSQYRLGDARPRLRSTRSQVEAAIGRPGTTLLDVRSASEYDGERFWPSGGMEPGGRAGHIPSAIHHPLDGLYDTDGSFRPAADLRAVFSTVDTSEPEELITYCTIGGRAATAWFVLTHLLGRPNVSVYDGSWAEWGRLSDTPIEIPQTTINDKDAADYAKPAAT